MWIDLPPAIADVSDAVEEIVDANGKTQFVRLIDVFALGPVMVWIALAYQIRQPQRSFLLISGIATILYNGVNYLNIRQRHDETQNQIQSGA